MEKASKSTTAASQQAATQSGGVQVSTQTPTATSSANLEANKAKDKGGVRTLFGSIMSRGMLIARNAIADRKEMVDTAIAQLEGKTTTAPVPGITGMLVLNEHRKPVLAVPVAPGSKEVEYLDLPKRVTDSLAGDWAGDMYTYHHLPEDDPWHVRIMRAIGPVGRISIDLLTIIALISCWILCASPIGQLLCGAMLLLWVFKGYEWALLPAPIKEEMSRLTRIPQEWQEQPAVTVSDTPEELRSPTTEEPTPLTA